MQSNKTGLPKRKKMTQFQKQRRAIGMSIVRKGSALTNIGSISSMLKMGR